MMAWHTKNVGPHYQTGYRNLLGMQEELGELCHSHLKQEQGIKMEEDHEFKKRDAIGDLMGFLICYCDSQNIDIEVCMKEAWTVVKERSYDPH